MNPVIFEVALNGETPKSRNPRVPRAPDEIASDGLQCLRAGASLLHNHIEDPFAVGEAAAGEYGRGWSPILAEWPDALLCPTMAAATEDSARVAHLDGCARRYGARLAPLDPGSMNMPLSGGNPTSARMFSYTNPYPQIVSLLELFGRLGMGASMGIYEPGFLRAAVAFHKAGMLPPGSIAKLYFFGGANYFDGTPCIGFGLDPSLSALEAYIEIIGDSGLPWAVAVIGGCVLTTGMARWALERGGHIRLGLEDYAGPLTPSNVELLKELTDLARSVGRRPSTNRGAASILGM